MGSASMLSEEIKTAVKVLQKGDVVAMPTETVYGLAASIRSDEGLHRIFRVKERPLFDPLIVHISDFSQKDEVVSEWPPVAEELARCFWPGPLTLVLKKQADLDPIITSGLPTVGIRMPRHPVALELIRTLGHPVAAPSANIFGRTSPTLAQHVREEFPKEQILILEGGACEVGLESTVLSIESTETEDILKILRPGVVTETAIWGALHEWKKPFKILHEESELAPGHLRNHYQPALPLVIFPNNPWPPTSEQIDFIKTELKLPDSHFVEMRLHDDPLMAARELYAKLHLLSHSTANFIAYRKPLVEMIERPQAEAWDAVWNRLEKASSLELHRPHKNELAQEYATIKSLDWS